MIRLALLSLAVACANALVCPPDACATVRCSAVTAENCAGGRIVKNGGFCGCCDSCVLSLAEGDKCVYSLLLGVPPTAQCAEGLVCDPRTTTCKNPVDLISPRQVMTCADRLHQIRTATDHGMPLLGQFIPKCETDGSYSARQCHGSVCYCADSTGAKILDYSAPINDQTMNCKCARDQHAYMQTGLIGKLFTCTSSGNYQRYQCAGSVCFCADELGNMKQGSPTVSIGQIAQLQC